MIRRPPEPLATSAIIAASRMSGADFAIDKADIEKGAKAYSEARLRAGFSSPQAGAGLCPPLVTRGERVEETYISDNGKILAIPARRGWGGDVAFLDWLNFSVKESTFTWEGSQVVTDDQLIAQVSFDMAEIFGFGITAKREKGANFYHRSYDLGDGFGMVCHGGNANTVLFVINGTGLTAAKEGWQRRLHEFLENAISPRITRVDLAHDDFSGATYSVDKALADFSAGLFSSGGRTPDCEQRGNWIAPNGKGRTFYVGHRVNGKYGRIYEKGKQLGDSASAWVRIEVEFKSVDREIPLDILFRAGEYLAAAYPAFEWISSGSCRIATTKKTAEINYQAVIDWCHKQCGAALWTIAQIEGSLEAAFSLVARAGEVPKRLHIPAFDSVKDFLHDRIPEFYPEEFTIDRAFSTI